MRRERALDGSHRIPRRYRILTRGRQVRRRSSTRRAKFNSQLGATALTEASSNSRVRALFPVWSLQTTDPCARTDTELAFGMLPFLNHATPPVSLLGVAANAGIDEIADDLQPFAQQQGISFGDAIHFGSSVALSLCPGAPVVQTFVGRGVRPHHHSVLYD